MSNQFNVLTNKAGNVICYIPNDFPEERISPEDMGQYLDGGERVTLKGAEYDLTEAGNLIDPEVEVDANVWTGHGVRLDKGTTFQHSQEELWWPTDTVCIGDRAVIGGTAIYNGVSIGKSAVIAAQSIGTRAQVGDFSKIKRGTIVASRAKIGAYVKIDRLSFIGVDVVVEDSVTLGYNTRALDGSRIGKGAKVGVRDGAKPRGVDQGGAVINTRKNIAPHADL